MKEIWKPVEGFEGYYEVSNTGKVRSVDRVVELQGKRQGEKRTYRGRDLRPLECNGYPHVHLQKGTVRSDFGLGKLVAIHFLEGFKESGRSKINYRDKNPSNCSIDNLYFNSTDET